MTNPKDYKRAYERMYGNCTRQDALLARVTAERDELQAKYDEACTVVDNTTRAYNAQVKQNEEARAALRLIRDRLDGAVESYGPQGMFRQSITITRTIAQNILVATNTKPTPEEPRK